MEFIVFTISNCDLMNICFRVLPDLADGLSRSYVRNEPICLVLDNGNFKPFVCNVEMCIGW